MIKIFTTGGTIEGYDYDRPSSKQENTKSIQEIIKSILTKSDYSIEKILDKDSQFVTDDDRALMASKIQNVQSSKILVTHGTITMVQTAKFLGQQNLNKTVVLTGAFILGTNPESDASFNLGFAISALQFLESGVYIAMNGNIYNWDNVRKDTENNRFESINK
ncbi:asparaginase [Aquaticitalea lipolytica]|uniref:Asparaginase n=1 Tax=Aquaticitalea lipolytica TaxID=1247562 RepID=A0A8J2TPG0_9FLAO|nr:asparaginase domain-containing protein [Aquaticitalea lipolytica]GFZ81593.1 asparaginase [Aquaticitalea lipolytica]